MSEEQRKLFYLLIQAIQQLARDNDPDAWQIAERASDMLVQTLSRENQQRLYEWFRNEGDEEQG